MISKELLSEVLGDIQDFAYLKDGVNYCLIGDYDRWHVIDNCNLAHKCKEWANDLNMQYEMTSYKSQIRKGWVCEVYENWHSNSAYGEFEHHTVEDTEPEAIFQACEWILSEINRDTKGN